jgi:hypothetical protein
MPRGNADNLRAAARRKSEQATDRAERALRELIKRGGRITFRGVAREAGCSEDFLYSHPDLRRRIEHLRGQQHVSARPPETGSQAESTSNVIQALTAQLSELRRRHHAEVVELREALAAAHGELLQLRRQTASRP